MELGRFISVFFFFLFLFRYFFCFCSPREDFSDSSPVSRSLSGSTNILSWFWEHKCVCLYTCLLYIVDAPAIPAILPFQHLPLSLSPRSEAFVLHSIIPLLQSGVEKRESGNFIIIASHFCNLYAMRTLRACSYNQVCRNHVRCFTNSWGDGSSSGDYGFPCC